MDQPNSLQRVAYDFISSLDDTEIARILIEEATAANAARVLRRNRSQWHLHHDCRRNHQDLERKVSCMRDQLVLIQDRIENMELRMVQPAKSNSPELSTPSTVLSVAVNSHLGRKQGRERGTAGGIIRQISVRRIQRLKLGLRSVNMQKAHRFRRYGVPLERPSAAEMKTNMSIDEFRCILHPGQDFTYGQLTRHILEFHYGCHDKIWQCSLCHDTIFDITKFNTHVENHPEVSYPVENVDEYVERGGSGGGGRWFKLEGEEPRIDTYPSYSPSPVSSSGSDAGGARSDFVGELSTM